jgi:hypothetical protein
VRIPSLRRGDDTGSLPMALLLTLVGMALSALLLPIALTQVQSTRVDARRVNALNAAYAGLEVALGQIRDVPRRTACDPLLNLGLITVGGCSLIGIQLPGIGIDLVSLRTSNGLPCVPLQGDVGAGSTASYKVRVYYLPADPRGKSDDWVSRNDWCSGGTDTVAYALVRSEGTDQGAARTLEATYTFETPYRNSTTGGLINIDLGSDRCMDAGSASPAIGAPLLMRPCAPGSDRQRFLYTPELTIVLAATRTGGSLGMCLQANPELTPNVGVTFQPCASPPDPSQQWILNDNGVFEGLTNGKKPSGYCFNMLNGLVTLGIGACNGPTLNWHAPPDGRPFKDVHEK